MWHFAPKMICATPKAVHPRHSRELLSPSTVLVVIANSGGSTQGTCESVGKHGNRHPHTSCNGRDSIEHTHSHQPGTGHMPGNQTQTSQQRRSSSPETTKSDSSLLRAAAWSPLTWQLRSRQCIACKNRAFIGLSVLRLSIEARTRRTSRRAKPCASLSSCS